ncbi:MAG: hypothetical protein AAF198_07560 [Pseudomonadota bacterium]
MIGNLLFGIVLAAGVFGIILWSLYQAVQQSGWRRWIHIIYIPILTAGFVPQIYAEPLLLRAVAVAIILGSVGFITSNRWPTVLLVAFPIGMAALFWTYPDLLVASV